MSLNTFFAYTGSKWSIARYYPAPLHDTIIEPFAGSAGYATRYHRRKVILVERDAEVAAVWRYLIKVSAREILGLPDLPEGGRVSEMRVHSEAQALIARNVARTAERGDKFTRWSLRPGSRNSVWGPVLRARLAAQVERIRHWRIIEGDYTEAPNVKATWFVDPPYQDPRLASFYRKAAGQLSFPALGAWCRSRLGQVIVCENDVADWLPFRPFRRASAVNRRGGESYSREVIWTNDGSPASRRPA